MCVRWRRLYGNSGYDSCRLARRVYSMELLEKPGKQKLVNAAKEYFARNATAITVGFLTKEGREFWYRRDVRSGEPVKISRQEAERL